MIYDLIYDFINVYKYEMEGLTHLSNCAGENG